MTRQLIILLVVLCVSCDLNNENEPGSTKVDFVSTNDAVVVQTARVRPKKFVARTVSNGKVFSSLEIPLNFPESGVVENVHVRNGMAVTRGQLLASLINASHRLSVREAELQLDEARVELNDLLITQGGKHGDSTSVSPDVYTYIRIRSGYERALLTLQKARLALSKTFLRAPASGKVANLVLTNYSPITSDRPFCMLTSNLDILVRCSIIETELEDVSIGQTAKIVPVGLPSLIYKGKVMDINPMVNPQGLVDIVVRVVNSDSRLLSGMNVRVMIENSVGDRLAVPKEAVVERGARKVVFTLEKDQAKWCYVVTGEENDKEIAITDGLKSGDEVIFSGNVNLAHGTKVKR